MTKRYFKFTDGTRTVFRGTGMAQGFAFGTLTGRNTDWIGFANRPVSPAKGKSYPAVEITKAEYDALVALKAKRVTDAGRDNSIASSPQNAWVFNAQLAS